MEKIITILRKLGLNRYESKAYLALVSSGVSTAGRLAEQSGIPRAKIYEVLRSLEKQGFAVSTSSRPNKFKPVELGDVVKKLHERTKLDYEGRVKQINEIHLELQENLKDLKPERAASDYEDMLWVLRGRDNIYSLIDNIVDESKSKIIGATTERGVVRKLFRHKDKLIAAADRGVDVRILAPITRSNVGILRDVTSKIMINHGNSVSARFVLSDDQRGVIILVSDEDGATATSETGVYINSPYFITGLGHYFEHKWEKTLSLDQRIRELGVA
jgi:sugar-specific transcriptional regulator TrmB